VTDVVLARALVKDIGGHGRVNEMLYVAYKRLSKLFPHDDEPHKKWSERRLRGWWNRESENVMHWQMVELYKAAAKAKEERALIDAARSEHAEFIRKTAAISELLKHTDTDQIGAEIEALRKQNFRVDSTGVEGRG